MSPQSQNILKCYVIFYLKRVFFSGRPSTSFTSDTFFDDILLVNLIRILSNHIQDNLSVCHSIGVGTVI